MLYRATRTADGQPVVLKVLAPQHRPQHLTWLKNEHEIGMMLNVPTAVRSIALETYEGRLALVMEDFGGESLDRMLGAPMEVGQFLRLAIRIASAVADIHQRNVVHKDIKPDNILVHPTTGDVKITDFGLASPLPCQRRESASARRIEGSLPYMSPEQTGRMNRAPDQRSDLYSLGVTFSQMLTGKLPFHAADPLGWVHCHIARSPLPPAELAPSVPGAVSAIVMKLLAKEAEDRYQTARGLRHDLERCLEQWSARERIAPFPLGERDVSDCFQIPQKFYGRDEEIAALLGAFERVVGTGAPEIVLVSGYAGIGKSSLVHELQKPIVRERGFFASGKFDQYKRDIPYATIVEAFTELVREILAESEEGVAAWKERLTAALGVNGQLIVDVIPPVELIIGRQPPAPALTPIEAQNRFRIAFRRFIAVFARTEHPLALFLDDLQWADSASLELLQDLITHPEARHFLVIGAYRNNEVTPAHPLMLTLDKVRKVGARISDIVLGPLSREQLTTLVSDTLHCSREDAAPLSRLVDEKTAGNPFFVIQFLTALHEERLIEFDELAEAWRWDMAKIHAKGFTDNVVDLMVGKLARLPESTQEALKQLACLGSTAEISILTSVFGRPEQDLHADLSAAVRAGLVLRLDVAYKFLHDRVREAVYSRIPEELRAEAHLRIGRLLLSRLPEEAFAERVFEVANQLNHSVALITDPHEKETLSRLNFQAGRKAKASIAYASARRYLAQATALLPEDAWSARYEDTFALYLELSECEYLVGEFQSADELFTMLLGRARRSSDRANVYSLRMRHYLVSGRCADGATVALEALELFGVTFPESDEEIEAAFAAEHREVSVNLRGRSIAGLASAPVVKDPDVRGILGLLVEAMPCIFISRPKMFGLLVTKILSFSLRYGNAEESCAGYTGYGIMLVAAFGDIPSGFAFSEMSLKLNEKFDDRKRRGMFLHVHGNLNFWRRHIASGLPILERAFAACLEVGDLVMAGHCAFGMVWHLLEKGDPLEEVLEASRKYAAFARHSHNDAVYQTLRLEQQFVVSLQGATLSSSGQGDGSFDEAASVAAIMKATFGGGMAVHHVIKQISAFTSGRYSEALESAALAAEVLPTVMTLPIEATHHFYLALTLAALYPQAPPTRQHEFAQTLEKQLQKLKLWADNCPENSLNRYALVSAEVARIEGRELEAERLYEQAIRSAGENGFVQNEGLAHELASAFYRARGLDLIADAYLRESRARYVRWGADGKVKQLDRLHPELVERRPLAPTVTLAVGAERLDVLSVVKASQAISGEIVLDHLLRRLIEIVIEQAGAQKGYVILHREGNLTIEAEALVDGKGAASVKLLRSLPAACSPLLPASVVGYVWRTKQKVLLPYAAEVPAFSSDEYIARTRPKSVLCLPILKRAELVGLLYLENNLVTGAFTVEQLEVLELLAAQAAISLESALFLAKEQAARVAAEEAEHRTAFLSEASELLGESLDYEQVLGRLASLSVREFADSFVIDLVEDGEMKRIAGMHADPAKQVFLDELSRRYPLRVDSSQPAARVFRTGEPLLLPDITDVVLRAASADDEYARLVRAIGTRTALSVPLVARGRTIGAITFGSARPGRRYGRADVDLAEELSRRVAIAVDNARLHRQTVEALRLREEFLSVASHELRTPMTALTLALHAMQTADRSVHFEPAAIRRLVALAVQQGQRMNHLVDSLLDVSRIDMGKLPLDLAEVDLTAVVREVVQRFGLDLAKSGCSVSVHDDGPAVGRWDRSRLDQVVTNLLANAIKFAAGKPIEIHIEADAGTARLIVKDLGIGIDPAQTARIFERFGRAVSAKHYGGLGLGLYISRSIVAAHGGSIHVTSQPGAGTTFTVELPCAPNKYGVVSSNP